MPNKLGKQLKSLRESRGLLQREVAAKLEVDSPLLSKMETGERIPRKDLLVKWGNVLKANNAELITLWLADRVYRVLNEEDMALDALRLAEDEVKYKTKRKKK